MTANSNKDNKTKSIQQEKLINYEVSNKTTSDQELYLAKLESKSNIPLISVMGTSQTGIQIFSGISAKINQSTSKTLSSDSPVQLFVYNMNSSTTLKDMKFYFSIAGPVDSIFIPASEKKKNRGFAFVQMSNRKSAKRAEQILDGSWLDKRRIQIMALNNCIDFEMPREALSIDQILKQVELIEQQKCEKLNELYEYYKKENIFKLLLQFDIETFEQIQSRINDFLTPLEHTLLNVVELISQRISELPLMMDISPNSFKTLLFNEIKNSGLISKIEKQLKQEIMQEEKKVQIISNIQEQLLRVYLLIMKGQIIQNNVLELCEKTISSKIQTLTIQIKQNRFQQDNELKNNNEIENKMKSITQLINVFTVSTENEFNVNKIIQQNLHKSISPLIHFNCPQRTYCQLSLNIKESSELQMLKASTLNLLIQLSQNLKIKENLISQHFILFHLIQTIINVVFSPSFQSKNKPDSNQSLIISSYYLLNSSLILLQYLLSNRIIVNYTSSTSPNITQAFIKLFNLRLNEHYNDTYQNIYKNIRALCRYFLKGIYCFGDEQIKDQICHEGYSTALIVAFSTAGGCGEENNNEISNYLFNLFELTDSLQKIGQIQQQPENYEEIKKFDEKIEEEGGCEEIESLLTNCCVAQWGLVGKEAIRVKKAIFSIFNQQLYQDLQ